MNEKKEFRELNIVKKNTVLVLICMFFLLFSIILKENINTLSFEKIYVYSLLADLSILSLLLLTLRLLNIKVFNVYNFKKAVFLKLGGIVLLISIVYIILARVYVFEINNNLLEYSKRVSIFLVFIAFVIVKPLLDNFFYRYIIINIFSKNYLYIGVVASSIFSIFFYLTNSYVELLVYFFINVFLGYIYIYSKSIEFTVLSQVIINLFLFISIFI